MRALALGAAAMRAFAALYVAIPAAMKRRGPNRSFRNPVPNCDTAFAIAKALVMSPSCTGVAPSASP